MASPQKENGYTAIANELMDAFMRLNLSEHAWRILFCIIRYSYGWRKKTAQLTCTQIAQSTGIDVRLIPRTLKNLQEKNIVIRNKNTFRLQKDYHKWSSSVVMKKFISRDEKSSSVEMKVTPLKRYSDNGSQRPKDIPKENIKTSIYKERLPSFFIDIQKDQKTYSPNITTTAIEQNKVKPTEEINRHSDNLR